MHHCPARCLVLVSVALLASAALDERATAQPCQPQWSEDFVHANLNGEAAALAKFDDGTDESLYIGGWFNDAGGVPARSLARWDGQRYHTVGEPFESGFIVRALTVFDDGSGPALYVGGRFTIASDPPINNIARWDGRSWSALGAGVSAASNMQGVWSMHVHNDGSGAALYVGGRFDTAGGEVVNHIARWDGQRWSALDRGLTPSPTSDWPCVVDMESFDDGDGTALYVAGVFYDASGSGARHFARWDGEAWSDPGFAFNSNVNALAVYDDGSGPALYIGGFFAGRLLRWNGDAATVVPGFEKTYQPWIMTMATHDDGSGHGTELYVAGDFESVGGDFQARSIAKWDGARWHALPNRLHPGGYTPHVAALLSTPSGLVLGGFFGLSPGLSDENIALWNGEVVAPLIAGETSAASPVAFFDDGSGIASMYAQRRITNATGQAVPVICRRDDDGWTVVGEPDDSAAVFKVLPDPATGRDCLFVGGRFMQINGMQVNRVARWDGQQWHALGTGIVDPPSAFTRIMDFVAADTGQGPSIFVCGDFDRIMTVNGTEFTPPIARWDGSQWHLARAGLAPWPGGGPIMCMEVLTSDDGAQSVIAGGDMVFPTGGIRPFGLWDGAQWSPLPHTMDGLELESPSDMTLFAGTCEPRLYATCNARISPEQNQGQLVMWSGTDWVSKAQWDGAHDAVLCAFNDGTSERLALAGYFQRLNGEAAEGLAWFDGSHWTIERPGFFSGDFGGAFVRSVASAVIDERTELAFAGGFTSVGGVPSLHVAVLRTCPTPAAPNPADVDGSGCVNIDDLLALVGAWGPCPIAGCLGDVNGDGTVDLADLMLLLSGWS